jgi:hypothetical protein
MNPQLRRVAKLRLRSSAEALNRRGAVLIEDALRTASLPDGDGARLLLIRKLPLGRIHASDPPSAVALRLEARARELGRLAVEATSPDAEHAPAVFFQDDAEAFTALAVRLALQQDTGAWFWPLAVPSWKPSMPRAEAMRAMLWGSLASSAGTAATLTLIRTLLLYRALEPLLSAVRLEDGPPLLREFGWTRVVRAVDSIAPAIPDPPSPVLTAAAAPWFEIWSSPNDARAQWLACALLAIERPALARHHTLPGRAMAWIESVCGNTVAGDAPAPATQSDAETALALPPGAMQSPVEPVAASHPAAEPKPPLVDTPPDDDIVAPSPTKRSQPSLRAGLFFLIPILERLGMKRWLEEHPDESRWPIPELILRDALLRMQTPPGDPAMAALGELPDQCSEAAAHAVTEWTRRIRRYARRTARIGLHGLICRPGRIASTDTHIDVLFPLDRADIRVRRAGLDLDPGWVPWLGRVIHFHYLGDDEYHGA